MTMTATDAAAIPMANNSPGEHCNKTGLRTLWMTRLYHTEIRDPDKNTLTSVPTPIVAMSTTEGRQGPGVQQDGRDARSSRELLVVGAMQLFFSLVTLLGLDREGGDWARF